MEFRSLKIDELDKWLDHCVYVFNNGDYSDEFKQYFKNHFMNDPWKDPDSIFVAVDEGLIVSTVRIFHRKIYLNRHIIDMGGIGEVSTRPEYQCRGLSTNLFSLAIKRMKEIDIKVSMLSAAHEKIGYYSKLGWQGIKRSFNVSNVIAKDEFNFNIRPVNFNTDIPRISMIHSLYSKNLNGTIVRFNEDYWNNWVSTEAKNFYVVEDRNKIIAYVDFDIYDNTIRIREFGELYNERSIFSSIVLKLAAINNLDRCEVIHASSIRSSFCADKIIEETNEMVRLINPFQLDDLFVENTEQLVKAIGDLTFWDIDSF